MGEERISGETCESPGDLFIDGTWARSGDLGAGGCGASFGGESVGRVGDVYGVARAAHGKTGVEYGGGQVASHALGLVFCVVFCSSPPLRDGPSGPQPPWSVGVSGAPALTSCLARIPVFSHLSKIRSRFSSLCESILVTGQLKM